MTLFSTKELLSFATINTRFHSLISRLLHRRLVDTASLPDYELILECYHPSAKISTPTLSCRYLGNKTWDGTIISDESPQVVDLQKMYSSFHPIMKQETPPRRTRARGSALPSQLPPEAEPDPEFEIATEDVYLDDGELFSQLCASTSVVRHGPRRGLLLSHVIVSEGVIRVWRKWLSQMSDAASNGLDDSNSLLCEDGNILWVDANKTVGLRFRIMLGPAERMPILTGPDDEPPLTYTLVYQGK